MVITPKGLGALLIFVLSIISVVRPISIRLPLGRFKICLRIDIATIPIIAISLLWAVQCADRNADSIHGIKPYNVLSLLFSLSYLAITVDINGVLESLAFWVCWKCRSRSGWKLVIYPYVMLFSLGIILGDDSDIPLEEAFVTYYAVSTGDLNRQANASLMSLSINNTVSTILYLGNDATLVASANRFRLGNDTLTIYLLLPFVVWTVLGIGALAVQFKYVPEKLRFFDNIDYGKALKDPIGSLIGFILLITCLVAIIIARCFFKIEACNISLPFAFVKFFCDIGRDFFKSSMNVETNRDVKNIILEEVIQMVKGSSITLKPIIELGSNAQFAIAECAVASSAQSLDNLTKVVICEGLYDDNSIAFTAYIILPVLASSAPDTGTSTHESIRDNFGNSDSIVPGTDIVAYAGVVVTGSCVVTVVIFYHNWRQKPTIIIQISNCFYYPKYSYYSGNFNGGNFGGGGVGGDGNQAHPTGAAGIPLSSNVDTDSDVDKLLREIEELKQLLKSKVAAMKLKTLKDEVAALKKLLAEMDG